MEGYTPGKFYRLNATGVTAASGNEFSYYCLMDIEALKKLAKENSTFMNLDTSNYNKVILKCADTETVASVNQAIKDMGYGTQCLQEWIEQSEQSIKQTQYLLGAIGGVSLLVAAIGIMNTMMMSIYERTKEIGILRSIGASKRDISSVFNAETLIIGFCAGAIGIIASMLLCIPLNLIVRSLTGIDTLTAVLPWRAGIILVLISMVLTLIAGIIPSRIAAKKDPVAALRSE